jgi:hypothetical protein
VAGEKTASEIEWMLQEAGVVGVAKPFDQGKMTAIYFRVETPAGVLPFQLPINVNAVYQLLVTKKKSLPRYRYREIPRDVQVRLHAQAERTAWRIIHWWVKSQLELIQTQMVCIEEVFLPYMLVAKDTTFFGKLQAGGFKALAALNDGADQNRRIVDTG